MLLKLAAEGCFSAIAVSFNKVVNIVRFAHWDAQLAARPLPRC